MKFDLRLSRAFRSSYFVMVFDCLHVTVRQYGIFSIAHSVSAHPGCFYMSMLW